MTVILQSLKMNIINSVFFATIHVKHAMDRISTIVFHVLKKKIYFFQIINAFLNVPKKNILRDCQYLNVNNVLEHAIVVLVHHIKIAALVNWAYFYSKMNAISNVQVFHF